jgi:hypothetical protein
VSYKEIEYSNGSFLREWRDERGRYHREDGPASICYRSDGSIRTEYFYLNGVQHRELGPAFIFYRADGPIIWEEFYLNGEFLGRDKEGFWVLWDNLNEEQHRSPEILKRLSGFS